MNKWFDDKFESKKIRKYTRKRMRRPSNFENFYRKLSITNWLIIINFMIYIIFLITSSIYGQELALNFFALTPNTFFLGTIWPLFTSIFSHVWLPHLLFNMISLFFIGNFVEKIIGRNRYLLFYIVSGLFAGLFYVVLSFFFGGSIIGARIFGDPSIPSLGASGAIFGIAGLLAVLTPRLKVFLIAGPIIALITQAVLSPFIADPIMQILNLLIYVYIFFSIFSIFSFNPQIRRFAIPVGMPFWVLPLIAIVPLIVIGLFVVLPIGNMAHLGGLIAGLAFGWFLKSRYPKKTTMIGKYFSRK